MELWVLQRTGFGTGGKCCSDRKTKPKKSGRTLLCKTINVA